MRLTLHEVAAQLGVPLPPENPLLKCAVTDSREVILGALFVCIPGTHVDGHDFAQAAAKRGAAALLVSRDIGESEIPCLRVHDTVSALGKIAAFWRKQTSAKVVGVTGTAGKTTVKDVLAQILALKGKTAKSPVNNNNQIGMPRAMLHADGDEAFWVMEAGISHAGDMEYLASVLSPDVGLILNVGAGHTEGLGAKGVAWHKTRMLGQLASGGIGIISADYPDLVREAENTGATLQYFSTKDRKMPYYAVYAGPSGDDDARGRYCVHIEGREYEMVAPFYGQYGAENVAAVVACAHTLGVTVEGIATGMAQATLPHQRFCERRVGSWLCIDDTYNANPLSMHRMLDAAAERAAGRNLIAVLGEMLELGGNTFQEHEALGLHLAQVKPAAVIWKGGQGDAVREGLNKGGYSGLWLPVSAVADFTRVWEQCTAVAGQGVALFKGSRANNMESLLEVVVGMGLPHVL